MIDIRKPAPLEFNLKINLFAYDKEGKMYVLALHTLEDVNDPKNIFLNYIDRVIEGDIIADKIKNFLEEDYGIEKILDMEFIETPKEDPDEETDEVFDYTIDVEIEYNPAFAGELGEVFASWFQV